MIALTTVAEMRAWSRAQRADGRRVALVPTMGALHEGHLLLIDRAAALADMVVMSVFVNPLQFGPAEDFDRYPRDLARDRTLASARGVACLFSPSVAEMYGEPAVVRVVPGALADHLCGPNRPGHFAGVLTVVAKLFHVVEPDVAVFGRKDGQQARLIQRMVADLDFPVRVVIVPTAREHDGVALSSRNAYLSADERAAAARIPAVLRALHAAFVAGERDAAPLLVQATRDLTQQGLDVEYVEAVDPLTLQPVSRLAPDTVVALAAHIGATRLIDNMVVGEGLDGDTIVRT